MPIPWLHNDTKIPSRPYLSDKKTLNRYNFFNFFSKKYNKLRPKN